MDKQKFRIKWKIFTGKRPISDEDLLYLFEQKNFKLLNHIGLSPENEVLMVNFNSFELFEWFVKFFSLREPAQLALLDNEKFFKHYVGLHELSHEVECELVRRNNEDLINYYVELRKLNYDAEGIMLKACSRNVIIPYIRMHTLYPLPLVKLIKSGNEQYIKTYINFHGLRWDTAQSALIDLQNKDLIKYFICRYELFDNAQVRLVQTQDEELLKMYVERHALSSNAKLEIFKLGNVRLFEICTKKE